MNTKSNAENTYNPDNWHVDIRQGNAEVAFLNLDFPLHMEMIEWIDEGCSKIDADFHDVGWTIQGKPNEPDGLGIAFMSKAVFSDCFDNVEAAPDDMCLSRLSVTMVKHENIPNKKVHPAWNCWIEIVSAKFFEWVPDEEEDEDED